MNYLPDLKRMQAIERVQADLDRFQYDKEILIVRESGEMGAMYYRSANQVEQDRACVCMDALFYACHQLREFGEADAFLVVNLMRYDEGVYKSLFGHAIAPFKHNGKFGTIGKSNYQGLGNQPPVFDSVEDIVTSNPNVSLWMFEVANAAALNFYQSRISEKYISFVDKVKINKKSSPPKRIEFRTRFEMVRNFVKTNQSQYLQT